MNSETQHHRFGDFGGGNALLLPGGGLANHGLIGYLLSIRDVVAALGIMITICGVSLLTLYTALGAL